MIDAAERAEDVGDRALAGRDAAGEADEQEAAAHTCDQSSPVFTSTTIGHVERQRRLHDLAGQRHDRLHLVRRRLEEQLVVHLQQHAALQAALAQRRLHAHHGDLDHVAGGPLHRRVHRHPLGGVAGHRVVRAQIGQVAAAAQQRGHVAALAALGQRAVDEGAHARVGGEVGLDVALRLLLVDLGRLRQAERRHAVEDGVVRALGDRALQRGDRRRARP